MAWVEILPRYTSLFRRLGWESADRFLSWTGVLFNRHRHRQVEQVVVPRAAHEVSEDVKENAAPTFFLKKEFNVTWRDRLRNAWHGFGWCATAVREGATLQALRLAGIGCPDVVALGESGCEAFLLTRDESAMTELRALLPKLQNSERMALARAMGRELARIHDAGFDHPDLFAKHVLVANNGGAFGFCILDWQRSRRRRFVPWRVRCRDLALLDATLHAELASDRLRLRCLRAYRSACRSSDLPPLRKLAPRIRSNAEGFAGKRSIREIAQAWVAQADQQFVPFEDGRLLLVRSFAEEVDFQVPNWLGDLSKSVASFADASGSDHVRIHSMPAANSAREIPALAHTLFRLQRFGVPAPRLLAVAFAPGRVHVVVRALRAIPLDEAIAKAPLAQRCRILREAGAIVRQIHEAGYRLPDGDKWARRLGVVWPSGAVVLARVEPLARGHAVWQDVAPVELNRQRLRLSRGEQLRFLSGYLRQRRLRRSVNQSAASTQIVERLARS